MTYEILKVSGTLVEHWKYQNAPLDKRFKKHAKEREKRYRKNIARRSDNVRRSVSIFRRTVRANIVGNEYPALFTLTMLQIVSLKASFRVLTRFFVRLRGIYGNEFRYIAVPEFQKRGAVHFHVLVWGIPEEKIETESTTRSFQRVWQYGFVDCIKTDGSVKLAGYLSKYLSKTMFDVRLGGQRAYSCSRNIMRSMRASSRAFSNEELDLIGAVGNPQYIHKFQVRFLGECTYTAYTKEDSYDIQRLANSADVCHNISTIYSPKGDGGGDDFDFEK